MSLTPEQQWERFKRFYQDYPELGLSLDISRMNFSEEFFGSMEPRIQKAFADMAELERGAIANPDENRMVGHYWLRNPEIAPDAAIRKSITDALTDIEVFSENVHTGTIAGSGGKFENFLIIGIGGSALGPQFVANALSQPKTDRMKPFFFDNTDPDGMDRVLESLDGQLGRTLVLVISKSGGTKETRNGMLEAKAAYERAGLEFESHACAVTGEGSLLDDVATASGWIKRFPMWDWVGGRTSELCCVGLLPAALQGFDIRKMLAGARACDEITRKHSIESNPAAMLALMWYWSGNGKGDKDMVVLPYKDRLELFSRYLQQLVMESIGKERDLKGNRVNQGIAVYGNKGSTDQHAYVQQLREGVLNFFAVFIEVLKDRRTGDLLVEPGVSSGDYLSGFFLGTREALFDNGRESITLTLKQVDEFSIGVLVALFERAVGLYASIVGINAYHQPGVEAGKKAAGTVIALQEKILKQLRSAKGQQFDFETIASAIGEEEHIELVFKVCEHLAANDLHGVLKHVGKTPFSSVFECK